MVDVVFYEEYVFHLAIQQRLVHPVDSMKAPEEVEEKEDLETNSDGFSILVVEDNEELKAFLKSILSENYTVITASNGEEGLQHAVDDLPDLIISDVMMPVMDGLEMIRQIKENNNICHIPIIVYQPRPLWTTVSPDWNKALTIISPNLSVLLI